MKGLIETYLIAALAGLLLCAGVGYTAYQQGKKVERSDWQAKELKAKDAAQAARDKSIKDARAVETAYAAAQLAASQTYQLEIKNVTTEKDRVIAAVRAGALRLRDPGNQYAIGSNRMPGAASPASGRNGETGAELSEPLSEFLVELTSDANAVVHQLTACQVDLLAAISTCNKGALQ